VTKNDETLDTFDVDEPRADSLNSLVVDGHVLVEWSDLINGQLKSHKEELERLTHRSRGDTRHVEPDSTSRVGEGRRAVGAVGAVCGDHCDDYDRGIGVRSWISEKRQGVTGEWKGD
jgi:hypothetical protein